MDLHFIPTFTVLRPQGQRLCSTVHRLPERMFVQWYGDLSKTLS